MKTPASIPTGVLAASPPTSASNTSFYPEDDIVPWMRGTPNTGNPIDDFMESTAAFAKTNGGNIDAALDRLLRS